MAKGTVKDPTGHQSKDYDFGYIQRHDLGWPEQNGNPWHAKLTPKAIPYLNKSDLGENSPLHPRPGIDVDFESREAVVCKENPDGSYTKVGTIGIAICTDPLQQKLMNLFPAPKPNE